MPSLSDIRLFDGMFSGMEQVLNLRSAQQTLIAGNVANADTPNYHARELPFESMLQDVMDRSARGEQVDAESEAAASIVEIEPVAWAVDGNSVNAEHEVTKMASNSVMYDAVSQGMSRRLALLEFAASDGKT